MQIINESPQIINMHRTLAFIRPDYPNRANSTMGFIDVANNRAVEGPFIQGEPFFFDPVSKLAYAEMHGKDNTNIAVKKGYINLQGVFMILKPEEGKW